MEKVIIIGCPGSGKSTFGRKLERITGLPLYHLDMMFWNEDRTTVPKELFIERLQETMSNSKWIIDGNYGGSMENIAVHKTGNEKFMSATWKSVE